ncbi:MAG: 16S rRNA (cytosine(1402)-N(4))-methyltransferase RsmH [Phycisphaerae bacterium]
MAHDAPEPAEQIPHGHEPVLLAETLDLLAVPAGGVVVDCTTGRGGHAEALANALGPAGTLIGLDMDPRNLAYARDRLAGVQANVRLFHANFAELDTVLDEAGVPAVDAVLADLGVSTNQLYAAEYGLSFSAPGPLDMRLNPDDPRTALDLVNRLDERELANVLYQYADERFSRRIARKVVAERSRSPMKNTKQLADLVRSVLPPARRGEIDPATRTFMALRMAVNREPENLERLLEAAPRRLKPGGRLAVISFHSGEDRAVKQRFRLLEQAGFDLLTKKPLCPGEPEVAANPKSRSAKLRALLKRSG